MSRIERLQVTNHERWGKAGEDLGHRQQLSRGTRTSIRCRKPWMNSRSNSPRRKYSRTVPGSLHADQIRLFGPGDDIGTPAAESDDRRFPRPCSMSRARPIRFPPFYKRLFNGIDPGHSGRREIPGCMPNASAITRSASAPENFVISTVG